MAESDLNYVKSIVRSILTSSSSSMTISDLLKDYAKLEGHKLPHKNLGFNSIFALLKNMDDILKLPPNPNIHSTIKLIIDEKTSHIIDLISKQKNNQRRNATIKGYVPTHKLNDSNSNMKYTTNSNTLENNRNARGCNFLKYHSNNSPKPKGYVTKELKTFIETMCGSNNVVSVLRLKYELINHPDYCKLNTTNIGDSVNMLKSFIYIKNNCVHLKDSEYNIFYQGKKLKVRNHTRPPTHTDHRYISRGSRKPSSVGYLKSVDGDTELSVESSVADYYDSGVLASLNNCSEDKNNLGHSMSILGTNAEFFDENSNSEIDEYGMAEGLDYSSNNKTNQYLFGNELDTQHKTCINSNKELSSATNYTKDACYPPTHGLSLCSEEENNWSRDNIQQMLGIQLKTIIKSDVTDYTQDACYPSLQSLSLCSEEENNLNTNHQRLNNTFTSTTLNKYHNTQKKSTGPDILLKTTSGIKPKRTKEIKTTVSSSLKNDKTKYKNMIVSIILNSNTPLAVYEVLNLFKIQHCHDFPLKLFGCVSVMDFFRLHPALFKLENEYSTMSIVTLVKRKTEKPRHTIRKSFMNASMLDNHSNQNTEKTPVPLLVSAKESILNYNAATNQCKEGNRDAQISDTNIQTSCSEMCTSIKNYEMYDSDKILDSMKKKLRCVLKKHENGILCNEFMDIYANEFSGFTFSEYGFKSMRDMAFNLPSVFYVKETKDGDDYVLYNACRRIELVNKQNDPALYYKNIPKTVMHNLSNIFDKYRTGISFEKLKQLYCTKFGLCYESLKYGFTSDKHMFESLNKMVEIKDNSLYTLDPFVYVGFVNENLPTELVQTYVDLGDNLLNGNSVCNKNFRYTPFQLTNDNTFMVFIAEIFHPSSFYIHLATKQETLNNLMAKLQTFYDKHESKYKVSPNLLFTDLACCLQFEDTLKWHRAIILDIVDEMNVKVLYVDYGSFEFVQKTRIRLLALEFGTEPILALHCCMFDQDKYVYTREIIEMFVEIVDGLKLEAHNGGYRNGKDGVRQLVLTLYLSTEKDRVNINKICIEELKRILANNNGLSIRRVMHSLNMKKY